MRLSTVVVVMNFQLQVNVQCRKKCFLSDINFHKYLIRLACILFFFYVSFSYFCVFKSVGFMYVYEVKTISKNERKNTSYKNLNIENKNNNKNEEELVGFGDVDFSFVKQ